MLATKNYISRDISWLSFNSRVLQEAADKTVPLQERIKFLGIFSNNLDEFFRVRVATLGRVAKLTNVKKALQKEAIVTLNEIQEKVVAQQKEFSKIWNEIVVELAKQKIYFKNHVELTANQAKFVDEYFDEEVESNVTPLMIQNIKVFPQLREKSLYLAVVIAKKNIKNTTKYALIEVPARLTPRFLLLPSKAGEHHIMLLEDVIRFSLPRIFSMFSVNHFESHIIKFTRDAELDIDNDINTNIIQKLEKGLKQRKLARPVRFIYDREINPSLLSYLIKRLNLTKQDNLMPGGRIHNFRHFIDFPTHIFKQQNIALKPFHHPLLEDAKTVTDVVLHRDVLLHFPYHSFDAIIDLLREAAINPEVTEIKITAYRLATQSKVINALINANKNGKKVSVMIELKARFDEEANLYWKTRLEEEGIKVYIGLPNMKVHAKICLIKKVSKKVTTHYGFVSTGNVNEKTAKLYSDSCLLTSNRFIMADVNRLFTYLQSDHKNLHILHGCKKLLISPVSMRQKLLHKIDNEIKNHKANKPAGIIIKLNSLTDIILINKLDMAAKIGVPVHLIIRSIFRVPVENKKNKNNLKAISIIDSYLEHSRILFFANAGKEDVYISSADWMGRNLDYRIEAACPIEDELLKKEIKDFLQIQLSDNTKARNLTQSLQNEYVIRDYKTKLRAQQELHKYFYSKTLPTI
jgi:polyphosphate kinase